MSLILAQNERFQGIYNMLINSFSCCGFYESKAKEIDTQ